MNQARKQADQVSSKYRSDLQNERVDAEGNRLKLGQDWVKQVYKTDLLELKASQSGIVEYCHSYDRYRGLARCRGHVRRMSAGGRDHGQE